MIPVPSLKEPEMNVALLGSGPLSLELTRCLSADLGERLVLATSDPAEILNQPGLDLLILDDFAPTALAVAERIASRTSLLVVPDSRQGSSFAYSLVLQDQDGPALLLPAFPDRFDPRMASLRDRLEAEDLGKIVSVRFERQSAGSAEAGRGPLFRLAEAQTAILRDADSLRFLLGEFRKVSAIQAGTGEEIANLTVTFGGTAGLDVFWTYRRSERDQADLVLQLEWGEARVTWNGPRLAAVRIAGELLSAPGDSEIPKAILGDLRQRRLDRSSETRSSWGGYMRDFDLVDAVGRSIRRRRTIDLHFEETSERSQFKTQMTTLGCAVAMFTLVGLVVLLAVGAVLDPRDSQQRLAEGAGLVIHRSRPTEDAAEPATLTAAQRDELMRVRKNYLVSPTAILIEGVSNEDPEALARRELVVRELTEGGFADADQRVVVRPFRGQWFASVMIAAWILLFLPLGVFLALQGLLIMTRSQASPAEN